MYVERILSSHSRECGNPVNFGLSDTRFREYDVRDWWV